MEISVVCNNSSKENDDANPQAQAPPGAAAAIPLFAVSKGLDAKQRYDKACAAFEQLPEKVEPKHAVLFFEDVMKKTDTAQQLKGNCIVCQISVTSTGAFKFHTHILNCSCMPQKVVKLFKTLRDATNNKREGKREAAVLAQEELQLAAQTQEAQQSKLKQQCIKAGIRTSQVEAADMAIANFMYANAIPFSAASQDQNSYFRKMIQAIQAAPSGYVPPSPKKMGNELLEMCHENMWRQIHRRDPDGALAEKFGSVYVSDGWDSCDSLPLINSAFISGNDGGIFWRSVDTSGKMKSAEYCAALMIADIYAYGPLKVRATGHRAPYRASL